MERDRGRVREGCRLTSALVCSSLHPLNILTSADTACAALVANSSRSIGFGLGMEGFPVEAMDCTQKASISKCAGTGCDVLLAETNDEFNDEKGNSLPCLRAPRVRPSLQVPREVPRRQERLPPSCHCPPPPPSRC